MGTFQHDTQHKPLWLCVPRTRPKRVLGNQRRLVIGILSLAALVVGCGDGNDAQVAALEEQVSELVEEIQTLTSTTTTSAPPSTDPVPTSLVAGDEQTLLQQYDWMENSDRVRQLQQLIGATTDGLYGAETRKQHLAALRMRGLTIDGVPSVPESSSGSLSPAGGAPSGQAPAAPDGGLVFARCYDCGQGFSSGSCANWVLVITNSSNLQVNSFTFAPPGAYWWDRSSGYGNDSVEIPADAPPRTINANLAPWATGRYAFQICTGTPSPGQGWEYNTLAPRSVSFVWSNGARGTSCYNLC